MRARVLCTIALSLAAPASAQAADLYVSPHVPGCSDTAGAAVARNPATPWCSLTPALGLAGPGDVVHLASATYAAQLRPLRSGMPAQPITYQAEGPVVIAPPTGTAGVMLTGVHDLVLRGLTVRAAAVQGIWIDGASRILIDRATVANRGRRRHPDQARHVRSRSRTRA